MFAGIFAAIRAFGIWQRISGAFGALWQLARLHPLAAILAISLAANGWQWHEGGVRARGDAHKLAEWQTSFAAEQRAFASVLGSYHIVLGAITVQNASISNLSAVAAARQKAAQAAENRVAARDAALATIEAAFIADAAKRAAAGKSCPSPALVIAHRGDL